MNYSKTNKIKYSSFKRNIYLGFNNIKNKKIRMIFTIIIIVITLLLINISDSLFNYNESVIKRHAKLLAINQEQFIQLEKSECYNDDEMTISYRNFTNEEINKINSQIKMLNKSTKKIYRITNKHIPSKSIMTEKSIFDILSINEEAFLSSEPYTYRTDEVDIVKWDDFNNFFINDIIGSTPQKNDEILISNRLAELLIKVGIKSYGEEKYYKPENFEELVSSNKYFHFGDADKVKIVGIINYNLSDFEDIKNISWDEYNLNMKKNSVLLDELSYRSEHIYNKIFVTSEFITNLILNPSNKLNSNMENTISHTAILIIENTENGFLNLLNKYKHSDPVIAKSTYSPNIDTNNQYLNLPYFTVSLLLSTFIFIVLSIKSISKLIDFKQDENKLINNENKKLMFKKTLIGGSFLIGTISTIFSCIALVYVFNYLQMLIGGNMFLNPFIINIRILWKSLFFVFILCTTSCIICFTRIQKINVK